MQLRSSPSKSLAELPDQVVADHKTWPIGVIIIQDVCARARVCECMRVCVCACVRVFARWLAVTECVCVCVCPGGWGWDLTLGSLLRNLIDQRVRVQYSEITAERANLKLILN